jgi:hypothetical protein
MLMGATLADVSEPPLPKPIEQDRDVECLFLAPSSCSRQLARVCVVRHYPEPENDAKG